MRTPGMQAAVILALACLLPGAHTFTGAPAPRLRWSSGVATARDAVGLRIFAPRGQDRQTAALRAGPFDFLGGKPGGEVDESAELSDPGSAGQAPSPERATSVPALPVALVQGEMGRRGGFRVDYKGLLSAIARASEDAAAQGVLMQQVEFPLDADDQGTTLVKRFEALLSLSERLAQLLGLQEVRSIGERIAIRDNINPGGGGEYLDSEGLFGLMGRSSSGEAVALVMLAGLDTDDLQQLEKTIYSNSAGGLGLSEGTRVLLMNTGLDRVTANQGFLGFGGAPAFLRSFEPVFYAKQIGGGFYFRDFSFPGWSIWGLPLGSVGSELSCVRELEAKISLWEAEQQIKALCRS